MSKILVTYGSTTGNTEVLAGYVNGVLKKAGLEVDVKNVTEVEAGNLSDYAGIIIGSSTWGIGELQDDVITLYEAISSVSLAGKKAAVFGPGDLEGFPDSFCTAVDLLEERLINSEANIVIGGLKIDGDVEASKDISEEWAATVAAAIA